MSAVDLARPGLGAAAPALSAASACEPLALLPLLPAPLPSLLAMLSAFAPLASGRALALPVREEVPLVPGAFLLRGVFPEEAARLCSAVRLAHSETLAGHSAHDRRRDSQHHCALHVPAASLAVLCARLRPFLPPTAGPGSAAALAPPGSELSTFLRLYHYTPGDVSNPHFDKSFTHCEHHVLRSFSAYSLLLYASDQCEGGSTTFFEAGSSPKSERGALRSVASVRPRVGDVLVFPHGHHKGAHPSPLHEGSLVVSGEKLLVRTDVIYHCPPPAAAAQRKAKEAECCAGAGAE